MSVLGEITPYHFNKKLIISLDERWANYFTSEKFQVSIKDNRIVLTGPKVSQLDPTTKSTATK